MSDRQEVIDALERVEEARVEFIEAKARMKEVEYPDSYTQMELNDAEERYAAAFERAVNAVLMKNANDIKESP